MKNTKDNEKQPEIKKITWKVMNNQNDNTFYQQQCMP